jgi:hypothetical protein
LGCGGGDGGCGIQWLLLPLLLLLLLTPAV